MSVHSDFSIPASWLLPLGTILGTPGDLPAQGLYAGFHTSASNARRARHPEHLKVFRLEGSPMLRGRQMHWLKNTGEALEEAILAAAERQAGRARVHSSRTHPGDPTGDRTYFLRRSSTRLRLTSSLSAGPTPKLPNSALHLAGLRVVRNCLAGSFPEGALRAPAGKPAVFPPEVLPRLVGPAGERQAVSQVEGHAVSSSVGCLFDHLGRLLARSARTGHDRCRCVVARGRCRTQVDFGAPTRANAISSCRHGSGGRLSSVPRDNRRRAIVQV